MYNSTLQRKTPLKAKKTLQAKKPLQTKTSLKTYKNLHNGNKKGYRGLKAKPYKPVVKYESIFTIDMGKCYITGDTGNIHPHHIFGASNKHNSEIYHFMLPLRSDWHEGTPYSIHQNRELELRYKRMCQDYWIQILHKTKEEFIEVFGKWW